MRDIDDMDIYGYFRVTLSKREPATMYVDQLSFL
jgi:hypothetical protein